ncbi:MAG: nucleotidyltransferase substrate binding protein [Alphaproteobacteria bacterium]|nr:nucleotidyltransferase substrate binding protein [Alphaproteobacteria bacterium]
MSRTATIDTSGLRRCIGTLETAFAHLQQESPDGPMRDVFRAACVKEFELVLEVGGTLLRRRLKDFFASGREADRLTFRDTFRHAAKHALVTTDACERWLQYRDVRNASAHDYGERFAETALELIPAFVADARALAGAIEGEDGG